MMECVYCGFCCKQAACSFGTWDQEKNKCKHLKENTKTKPYICDLYSEIIKDPSASFSPAFGSGCCSNINEDRRKVLEQRNSNHPMRPKFEKYFNKVYVDCGGIAKTVLEDRKEDLFLNYIHRYSKESSMNYEEVTKQIVHWLKEQLRKSGQKSFIVGVSGGVDSGLVSTLCALTLEPTYCVHMPIASEPNELALDHMKWLSRNWPNVKTHSTNLSNSCTYLLDSMYFSLENSLIEESLLDLMNANIQSRLRMIALYSYANVYKGLVVGTGNKIEDFGIGFFTKYGDGGVDISPIGDLLKTEVKGLAEHLGVNEKIVNAIPTDGLWGDSRSDEDQIGASYYELERAMQRYPELEYTDYPDLPVEELINYVTMEEGLGSLGQFSLTEREKEVDRIYLERHFKNRHKMKMPPICKIERRILDMDTYYLNDKQQKELDTIVKKDQLFESMRFYDSYRNCAVMSQWIMLVCKSMTITLPEIEVLLREKDCNSYLLGLPSDKLPKHQKAINFFKDKEKPLPYFLWICVNGKEEALKTLSEFDLTEEQNKENLANTGFICERER